MYVNYSRKKKGWLVDYMRFRGIFNVKNKRKQYT